MSLNRDQKNQFRLRLEVVTKINPVEVRMRMVKLIIRQNIEKKVYFSPSYFYFSFFYSYCSTLLFRFTFHSVSNLDLLLRQYLEVSMETFDKVKILVIR